MTELPPNSELLWSASLFKTDPAKGRERLAAAVELPVAGQLYEQLRTACQNALKAPRIDLPLACEGIGEVIAAIRRDVMPDPAPPRLPYRADIDN